MALSLSSVEQGKAIVIFDNTRPAGSRAVCSLVPVLCGLQVPKLRECRGIVDGRSIQEAAARQNIAFENTLLGQRVARFNVARSNGVAVNKAAHDACANGNDECSRADMAEVIRAATLPQCIRNASARIANRTALQHARVSGLTAQAFINQANDYAACVATCNARKAMIDANRARTDALRFVFSEGQITETARLVRAMHACSMVNGWSNERDPLPLVNRARVLMDKHLKAMRAGTGDDSISTRDHAKHAWRCAYTESRNLSRSLLKRAWNV